MVTARIADSHAAPLSRPARLSGSPGVVPEPILVPSGRPGKRAVRAAKSNEGTRGTTGLALWRSRWTLRTRTASSTAPGLRC